MYRVLRHDEVHAVDGEGQEESTHKDERARRHAPLTRPFDGGSDERRGAESKEQNMQPARDLAGDEGKLAVAEIVNEKIICHADTAYYAALIDIIGDIGIKLSAREAQHRPGYPRIEREGDYEHKERFDCKGQSIFCALTVQEHFNHVHDEKACRERDIGLINAEGGRHKHCTDDAAPLHAAAEEIRREHCAEERERIGRACEHEAENPRLRGKGGHKPRKQHLDKRAFDIKKADYEAHGQRYQHKADKPPEPRQGVIREERFDCFKPPAARGYGCALAEERLNLIGIDELICKGKHMRRKPKNKCRGKGQAVTRRYIPKLQKSALKRRAFCFVHLVSPFFFRFVRRPCPIGGQSHKPQRESLG